MLRNEPWPILGAAKARENQKKNSVPISGLELFWTFILRGEGEPGTDFLISLIWATRKWKNRFLAYVRIYIQTNANS